MALSRSKYANLAAFPGTGIVDVIYIDESNGNEYIWNSTTYVAYSPANIGILNARKTDAWFTANPNIILGNGQKIYLSNGAGLYVDAYKIGDGLTSLEDLDWKGLKQDLTDYVLNIDFNNSQQAQNDAITAIYDTELPAINGRIDGVEGINSTLLNIVDAWGNNKLSAKAISFSNISNLGVGLIPTASLTIDGVSIFDAEYFLAANQTDPLENGLWQRIEYGSDMEYVRYGESINLSLIEVTNGNAYNNTVWKVGVNGFYRIDSKPIIVGASITAQLNYSYTNITNRTYSDPTPVEGQGFEVLVRNGTATIGGVAYSVAGTVIKRIFHSGSWSNYVYLEGNRITQTITNGVTDRAPSEDAVFDALALKKDHATILFLFGGINPADSTTYYGGSGLVPSTTAANQSFRIPYSGIIKGATIIVRGNSVSGSAENNTMNFRNVTQASSSLIINSFTTNASTTALTKATATGLNISFNSTDDICLEWISPAWVTNPQSMAVSIYLDIEKTS